MARIRGITEKTIYLINPLPEVGEAELLKEAGLDMIEPKEQQPFEMHLQYSYGLEKEQMHLQPQQRLLLRESEGPELLASLQELGAVVVSAEASDDEVAKAHLRGLQTALKYWRDIGGRLTSLRKDRGLSKEDMEEYRYDYWPYFLAAAKAKYIENEIKKLRRQPARESFAKKQ